MNSLKTLMIVIGVCLYSEFVFAQTPQGINYQGQALDAGNLVKDKTISIKISIIKYKADGAAEYTELHSIKTNSIGVFSVVIGTGVVTNGNFTGIDWSKTPKFMKSEIDINGGSNFTLSNTSSLVSVPYAHYAQNVKNADKDTTNEIQIISRLNDEIVLSKNGGKVNIKDADADPTNEIQNLSSVLTQSSDAGAHLISNLVAPVQANDAATKGYVDQLKEIVNALQSKVTSLENSKVLSIGDVWQGGIVFYIDGTGKHGLVTATLDQGYSAWGCNSADVAGATGTAIGTGSINTAAILMACGGTASAAQVCKQLTLAAYTDWFLPSKDELYLMYLNLKVKGLGGFSNLRYLSSSQTEISACFIQDFGTTINQSPTVYDKFSPVLVRAIRAF